MKTRNLFVLLFISIGLAMGLFNIGKSKGSGKEKALSTGNLHSPSAPKQTVCIMLIDPTMALEEAGLKKIARSVFQITKALPANSVIEVRQIDDNPYLAPLASYTVPAPPVSPPSAIRAYPLKVEKGAKMLGESVFRQLKAIKAETPDTSPKSCIVRGLETAYNALKHYPQSTHRWEVIVMSDMIEECDNSPIGKLYMTPEDYDTTQERIKSYKPSFDLSHADLSVLVVRKYQPGDPEYLHPDNLRELWNTVFTKVGYAPGEIDQMYFGSSIPPRFQGGVGR